MTTSDNIAAIEKAAKEAADAVGVTPYSDMRLFVEQAVQYALSAEARKAEAMKQEIADLREAAKFAIAALETLQGYEADLGDELLDDYEIGRIEDSRHSPSFRIRVGHIRRLARTLLNGGSDAQQG